MATCWSPWLGAALALLHQQNPCLSHVHMIENATDPCLDLMALFSKITTCTLQLPTSQPLSLQALQALPHLQCLALHSGLYCGIDAAEHLTSLSMTRAQAECTHSCLCVRSLVQLELESSTIIGLHANGLAACSCLEALRCISSYICASDQAAAVDRQEVQICASISSLTGLTKLHLGMYTQDAQVELCWLSRLSSLNRLWPVKLMCIR